MPLFTSPRSRPFLLTLAMPINFWRRRAYRRRAKVLQHMAQATQHHLAPEELHQTTQLTELTRHLLTAREDERHRLARNLHDDLGALLTSAKLDAARIKSRMAGRAPEAQELLVHLVGTLNEGIALGRRIVEDLRPSALSHLGLVATLEILAREFADSADLKVHANLGVVSLEPAAELTVFRLVQEATTNIAKYAHASEVWIDLAAAGNVVTITVRDNGVGFDTTSPRPSAFGLLGMRFRVEAEGGALELRSTPKQGTSVRASLAASKPDKG